MSICPLYSSSWVSLHFKFSKKWTHHLLQCYDGLKIYLQTLWYFSFQEVGLNALSVNRWGLMPCPWTRGGINHSLLMSGIGRKDVWDLRVVKNIVASSLLSLGSPGVGEDVCHNWRVFKPPVERRQETEVCQQPAVTCQPCDLNSSELLSQSSLQMVQPQLKYNPAKLLLDSSPTETLRW